MHEQIRRVLDVTIVYPVQRISFWDFVCGRIPRIRVHVRALPVSVGRVGAYARDRAFRLGFQQWLNGLWCEKDARIRQMTFHPDRPSAPDAVCSAVSTARASLRTR
jgi:hypothetical protein